MEVDVIFEENECEFNSSFDENMTLMGPAGKSAYQIACDNGFKGTESQWLASLKGVDGKSAYEIAVDAGYKGTIGEYYAELSSFGEKAELAKRSATVAKGSAEEALDHSDQARMYSSSASSDSLKAGQYAQSAKASAEEALNHSNIADSYSNNAYTSYIMAGEHAQASKTSAEEAKKSEDMAKQAVAKLLINGKASGKVAAIDDAANMPILGLTVNDGTPVETVKFIGKNFFHRDYDKSVTNIGVTAEWDAENQEFILNGTTTAPGDIKLVTPMPIDWVVGENYTVSVSHIGGTATLAEGSNTTTYSWGIFQDNASKYIRGAVYYTEFFDLYNFTAKAFELDANHSHILYFQCWRPGTVFDNYRVKVQIEKGDTVTDWEAYREETVAIDNAQSLMLQKGYNNIIAVPMADITAEYVVDLQMYIDKKIESLK